VKKKLLQRDLINKRGIVRFSLDKRYKKKYVETKFENP